jgi:hypothetical protein
VEAEQVLLEETLQMFMVLQDLEGLEFHHQLLELQYLELEVEAVQQFMEQLEGQVAQAAAERVRLVVVLVDNQELTEQLTQVAVAELVLLKQETGGQEL